MSLRNYGQTSTNGHLLTTGTSPTAAFSPHGGRKTVSIFLNIKMLYPPKKTGVILNPLLPKTATYSAYLFAVFLSFFSLFCLRY